MRIVSLLPSATEMVCVLGLREQLVGVTHECDYPADVASLPKVTRTLIPSAASSREIDVLVRERLKTRKALYTIDRELLERLAPDLIVTQGLCDVCAVAQEEVQEAACSLPTRPAVLNLEPTCLEDVFTCLERVAEAAGMGKDAVPIVEALKSRVQAVAKRSPAAFTSQEGRSLRPRVTLLEWIDPPFTSGHWGPQLVELAGGREGIGRIGEKSRTLSWEEIMAWRPEVLFIACCGFSVDRTLTDIPILQRQPGWPDLPCVRSRQVYVADGSAYFSRPGPRLVDSLEMLAHALHPDTHPLPASVPAALRLNL